MNHFTVFSSIRLFSDLVTPIMLTSPLLYTLIVGIITLLLSGSFFLIYHRRRSISEIKYLKENNRHVRTKMEDALKRIYQLNDEIEETYRRDSLTGAYNFRGFLEQVTFRLTQCINSQSYHVICFDLNDFKQVNMRVGVETGDQILIHIAKRLNKILPSSAHIARFDGDQFAIGFLGENRVLRESLEKVEKMMGNLEKSFTKINYCLGTATFPDEANCGAELIRLAEFRLSLEQRRLHHKEEEQRRHLEKLSAVGQLAAGLAHEIRNPLTSIRGFVQISASESNEVKKWESIIIPEIDRINDLLKQFLNLSESKPPRLTQFNLDQLIQDVIQLLQPKAILMGHQLIGSGPSSIVEIEADAEQLKQVLINLIQNGLEALMETGKVEVQWKAIKNWVTIHIRDTGSGIKPELVSRIFDPFFTTKEEGTGMGLSICHRIITDHGGQVYVKSQSDRGTVFTIHLPLIQDKSFVMEKASSYIS